MKVSFIVPVVNETRLTKACLESLEATLPVIEYEIILVDDGSLPEIASELDQLTFKNLTVIHAPRNQGFAAANNLGVRHSSGEILFLINNDLVLQPGWFEPMRTAFDRFPDLGIIGNIQLNATTKEIDHAGCLIDQFGKTNHTHRPRKFASYPKYDAVTGACCAIKRRTYLRHGGFDESYRNGSEDIDLCFRLAKTGHSIRVANFSKVLHHVSATRSPKRSVQQESNARLLQNRWNDQITRRAARSWSRKALKAFAAAPQHMDWDILMAAASDLITGKTSSKSLLSARCHLERNERYWLSIIDNWTDEMIKDREKRKNANWLKSRVDYHRLYSNPDRAEGVWIRDYSSINIPAGITASKISVYGTLWPAEDQRREEKGSLGLKITVNRCEVKTVQRISEGEFTIEIENPPVTSSQDTSIDIQLKGVAKTNAYAYLGRVWKTLSFIPKSIRHRLGNYREQRKNKRLMLHGINLNNEQILDFKTYPTSPLIFDFARKYGNIGINLVGWFDAELGIGESARSAAKALKQSDIDTSFVPLKVNCLANRGDQSLAGELQEENPHPINIFHIDAPQSCDIDHHHGEAFRKDKYNIAYWAWELPEFPDAWIKYFEYFDEIWCPSNFVRDSIAMKSPTPVLTIPHCIDFEIPKGNFRQKLGLPQDLFLFSFIYDLNSYQERKNPQAALEAFKLAFSQSNKKEKVGLVIKTQSAEAHPLQFAALQEVIADVENCTIIDKTLPREQVYGLMKATDCYVSLHRSEGFGLTVAESMFLGKPVIATDWSATTEFLDRENGLPVSFELQTLKKNFGPYQKGQLWAEPCIRHAAEQMQKIVHDPNLGKRLGRNAAKRIRERNSPEVIANLYEKRIKSIALW